METIPEFGIKRENEERRDGGCGIVFDPQTKLFAVGKQDNGLFRLFSGGVRTDEDIEKGVLREVIEESGLSHFSHIEKIAEAFAHYYNTLRNVNRVAKATCFLMILTDAELIDVQLEEHEKFSLAWATEQEIVENWKAHNKDADNAHWIYFMEKTLKRLRDLGYEL